MNHALTTPGMSNSEIVRLTNKYVGVSGGYLGDFSYRSHRDFYPLECDIDIDPTKYGDTTRYRFEGVLKNVAPADQAKIIRGTLKRFPVGQGPATRTQALAEEFEKIAARLEGNQLVGSPTAKSKSAVVERAISDAETLIGKNGATSAVDRVHTALHGQLKELADDHGIAYPSDPTLTQLLKQLRSHHPALADLGPRAEDIAKVLNSMASILDALSPVRNRASVAHPNSALLGDAEARLAINAARTIHHYLDDKLR